MNFEIQLKLVCVLCLLFIPKHFCSANELPQNEASPFCSYEVVKTIETPYSVVTFTTSPSWRAHSRWMCMDGRLILAAGRSGNDENTFYTSDLSGDDLRENGKLVERQGHPVVLRMVVNEGAYPSETYNSFWLLDFRNKEPLIVGPMMTPGLGRMFSVIWHEDNVIVVFDDDGGPGGLAPRRYHKPNWGKEERYFVKGIEAEAEDAIYETRSSITNMVNRPLMNKDGVFHPGKRNYINMPHNRLVKNGKLIPSTQRSSEKVLKNARNVYPGYYYDYKTKKLTEIAIEED